MKEERDILSFTTVPLNQTVESHIMSVIRGKSPCHHVLPPRWWRGWWQPWHKKPCHLDELCIVGDLSQEGISYCDVLSFTTVPLNQTRVQNDRITYNESVTRAKSLCHHVPHHKGGDGRGGGPDIWNPWHLDKLCIVGDLSREGLPYSERSKRMWYPKLHCCTFKSN